MKRILQLILGISISTLSAQVQIQMPQPAQSSTFSSSVRGYYFVAPTCFTITGAMIPTDNAGDQSIAILRMETIPPVYSATTNNFDVLYLTQNDPNQGIHNLNIVVNQGDVIGILAQRGTTCSYAIGPYTSDINGFPVTLNRMGMQYPLTTTPPQEIWTENGGSISRMFLYYDTTMIYNLTHTNVGADYTFSDGTDTLYTTLFSVWDYGDSSPFDTNYTPTHTYSTNGTYNVCSYIHTACGVDTVCSSVNVCIYPPIAAFSDTHSGLTVDFTNTGANGSVYSWDFGDGNTSTSLSPMHTYSDIGTYVVTQIVGNSCFPNDTLIDTIVVCTDSYAGFSVTDAGSGTANFTNSSAYGIDYLWDFGDSNTDTSATPSHTYAVNGTYNVCLISENMCSSDTLCTSLTICPDMPTATFTSAPSVFTASFTNTSNFDVSSHWNFGDGNTSTTSNPSHTYSAAGNYNVCLTSFNECGDSSITCNSVTIAGNVGIEQNNSPLLNIYPNPVNDAAVLNIYSSELIEGKIYVTDITGKVVATVYSGNFSQGNTSYNLNFSIYANGIYLLVWETEKWKASRKIIVN